MNALLNGLQQDTNLTSTENGGITHKSTLSKVLDLFALGASYRNRSDDDVKHLFSNAFNEDRLLAMKNLFYIRDVRGGQGERRFFREVLKWLASFKEGREILIHNLHNIPFYGRWDDLYVLFDTPLKPNVIDYMREQLAEDMQSEHPSLLAKWMKSENTSSAESRAYAKATREAFHWTPKQYRRTLADLRKKIGIVESKMSYDLWHEINYATVPSKAGLIYRKAFLRHDEERYSKFIEDDNTTVKAAALYPYEIVEQALRSIAIIDTERNSINKYWNSLPDYLNGSDFSAICMVDTSGSMYGTPLNVAISLGMYFAERNKGPFKDHYISFSSRPQLVHVTGYDFVDKVNCIRKNCIVENTNIEAAFKMLLTTAVNHHVPAEDMPKNIIVISDMEFDQGTSDYHWSMGRRYYTWETNDLWTSEKIETTMENIAKDWKKLGYELPNLIYWNVDARQDNIPMIGGRVSYVSGFSPTIFDAIIRGKSGYDLMLDKLNSERYKNVVL